MRLNLSLLSILHFTISALAIPTPNVGFSGVDDFLSERDDHNAAVIGPFSLITHSDNKTLDNLIMTGYHIGAGIDLAIVTRKPKLPPDLRNYLIFYLNTTAGSGTTDCRNRYGTLEYPIFPENPTEFTGSLSQDAGNNVAELRLSVLTPLKTFNFDKNGRLGIGNKYARWMICDGLGVEKNTIGVAWLLGNGEPDNKTCQRIEIRKGPPPN